MMSAVVARDFQVSHCAVSYRKLVRANRRPVEDTSKVSVAT